MDGLLKQRAIGAAAGALLVGAIWGTSSWTGPADPVFGIGSRSLEVAGNRENLVQFTVALAESADVGRFELHTHHDGAAATVSLNDDVTGQRVVALNKLAVSSGLSTSYQVARPNT